jgi:hypothetical protein
LSPSERSLEVNARRVPPILSGEVEVRIGLDEFIAPARRLRRVKVSLAAPRVERKVLVKKPVCRVRVVGVKGGFAEIQFGRGRPFHVKHPPRE